MVDRVDKPEAPPPYRVTQTTEAKKDKPQDERRQEDLPTFKQKDKGENLYREKFQSEASSKTFKVPLNEIQRLLFLRAVPRHGVPMVDADLIGRDGKKIPSISFLLKNWQDFMQIKKLKAGETIPPPFWSYGGTHIEVTMRSISTSGPWNLREIEKQREKEPLAVAKGFKKPSWSTIGFIAFGLMGLAALLLYLFG